MKAIETKILNLKARRSSLEPCQERKALTRQIRNLQAALLLLQKDVIKGLEVREGVRADKARVKANIKAEKAIQKAHVKNLQAHILG